jgi:pyruvate formate lyase activating enzyme
MPDNAGEEINGQTRGQTGGKDLEGLAALLMQEIEKDLIFYEDSGGGVTFSGGEPLSRPDLLFRLLDLCRAREIHTCVDTSGYADADIVLTAARKAGMILYDLKLIDEVEHKKFTGKSVALVLNNLKQLSEQKAEVRLRFPLIPGITDTRNNINGIISFVTENIMYRKIHILPFHRAGYGKYEALNLTNHMKNIEPPSKDRVAKVKEQFESKGFSVSIGG